MTDQILSLAMALMHVDGGERELLEYLCSLAEEELRAALRPGVNAEACPAFGVGAAWLALSYLAAARETERVKRFSAGDLSVERGEGGGSGELRRLSERAMAPYVVDGGFAFRGVRG